MRSIRAAFISAPPADKFIARQTRETIGSRSCAICQRCFRWRCRRSDERKLQIPSSKHQRNSNDQTPKKSQRLAVPPLELDVWSFPGAWCLVLGAFPMIRIVLPNHLRTRARASDEVQLELNGSAT